MGMVSHPITSINNGTEMIILGMAQTSELAVLYLFLAVQVLAVAVLVLAVAPPKPNIGTGEIWLRIRKGGDDYIT